MRNHSLLNHPGMYKNNNKNKEMTGIRTCFKLTNIKYKIKDRNQLQK